MRFAGRWSTKALFTKWCKIYKIPLTLGHSHLGIHKRYYHLQEDEIKLQVIPRKMRITSFWIMRTECTLLSAICVKTDWADWTSYRYWLSQALLWHKIYSISIHIGFFFCIIGIGEDKQNRSSNVVGAELFLPQTSNRISPQDFRHSISLILYSSKTIEPNFYCLFN